MQKIVHFFRRMLGRESTSGTTTAAKSAHTPHVTSPGVSLRALEQRTFPLTREEVASTLEADQANPQLVAFVRKNGPERYESLDQLRRDVGRLA